LPYMDVRDPGADVYGLTMDRKWRRLRPLGRFTPLPVRAFRTEACEFLRRKGVRWIVVPASASGHGPVGRSLRTYPNAWGVEEVDQFQGVFLFRLR